MQESWFEVLLVRTDVVKDVRGGISAIIKALLGLFWNTEHDAKLGGISLRLFDQTMLRVFMQCGIFIADESALHATFCCKGSSGLKPCLLCANVFNNNTSRCIVENDATGFAQGHDCTEYHKLVLHTPATIAGILRRLSSGAAELSQRDFSELQTRLGWNYVPEGVLMDARWREVMDPSHVAMYDWMHVWLVGGVFNIHMGLLMQHLKPHGLTYAIMHEYASMFNWPAAMKGNTGVDALTTKRAKSSWDDCTLKAAASECLSLFPVVANYILAVRERSRSPEVVQHCTCFLLLVKVLELLQSSARGVVQAALLRAAIEAHLEAFKSLYGTEAMTPKFHSTLHFPDFLSKYGFLPNCFVLERKHKGPKRYGNEIRNTSGGWEASVLREVTNQHITFFSDMPQNFFDHDVCLLEPHTPSKRLLVLLQQRFEGISADNCQTSKTVRINRWERASVGDVVLIQHRNDTMLGEIVYFVAAALGEETSVMVGLHRWTILSDGLRSWKCRRRPSIPFLCMADELVCTIIWGCSGDSATALKPHRL